VPQTQRRPVVEPYGIGDDLRWDTVGLRQQMGAGLTSLHHFQPIRRGHAVFGGAVFEVLRTLITVREDQSFIFVSDEFNGENRGIGDVSPRPRLPQSFVSFAHPKYLNARSRIFLGIHFKFDATVGIAQGNEVAKFVPANRAWL
jgi:hypothetical protein